MRQVPNQTITAFIITIVFLGLGMILLESGLVGYGVSFFVFLPFVLGIVIGSSFFKKMSQVGLVAALILFVGMLLAGDLEGMVCVLMAMPLVLAAMAIGAVVKTTYDKAREKEEEERNKLRMSIVPLALFVLVSVAEKKSLMRACKGDVHVSRSSKRVVRSDRAAFERRKSRFGR